MRFSEIFQVFLDSAVDFNGFPRFFEPFEPFESSMRMASGAAEAG